MLCGAAKVISIATGGVITKETVIIGVEPKEVDWGMELSEELRGRIRDVVKVVLEEITPGRGPG